MTAITLAIIVRGQGQRAKSDVGLEHKTAWLNEIGGLVNLGAR
jgi:hypothetical protein